MMSNPYLRALRYDPYGKTLLDERYDTKGMKTIWRRAIEAAVSPDSIYLKSCLATWDKRAIREFWYRFEICSPGMVNTSSYCS